MEFLSDFSAWTLVLMAIIFGLTFYFQFLRYNSRTAESAPTILTSIGIFGTFLGVALGLVQFDTSNLQASVPLLLEGLKTAFWSSIFGLLGSLSIKIRVAMDAALSPEENITKTATIDDLDHHLADIVRIMKGETEEGLVGQLAEFKQEYLETSSKLYTGMMSYQDRMVEANTQALIDALGSVMSDFNVKINEQYGDNFKRLNESVGNMVEWQENYKDQLGELADNQKTIVSTMKEATEAYEKMVVHAKAFTGVSESLSGLLSGLNSQREVLDTHLHGLARLVTDAAEGLPKLEDRIQGITTNLAGAVEENTRQVKEFLTEGNRVMSDAVQKINSDLLSTVEASQQQISNQVESIMQQTEKQVMRLDDAMEAELNKALKTFGMQLAALSEKFVSDYTPLTKKLKELIQIAEKA